MWLRDVIELRERYSANPLPQPFDTLARVCWKTFAKPVVQISTRVLGRRKGFRFPENWEWEVKSILNLYEKETVEVCKRVIKSGMTVLDIGAHVGYYTRLFSQLVGPEGLVYAFEPHPENYQYLKNNTGQLSNVVLINKALSYMGGSTRLFLNTKSGCHSLFPQPNTFAVMEIEVITLDEFWEERGRPSIGFIKMDIEGAEASALKGGSRVLDAQKHIKLITEFCPAHLRTGGTSPEELLSILSGYGFRYFVIGPQGELLGTIPELKGLKYENLYCEKM